LGSESDRSLVWILGLHHSGTTIFWRAFRGDTRNLCFDEPFTPNLGAWFPRNNPKATFDEYLEIFGSDPSRFRDFYAPIEAHEELEETFSAAQVRYLRFLIDRPAHVVIDETHLHRRLPGLARLTPDAHVIHLYRRASSVVSSYLLPSVKPGTGPVRRALGRPRRGQHRRTFWSRRTGPVSVQRDRVVGDRPDSTFGVLLRDAGYDADRIMAAPMVVRLLACWHYLYRRLERQGPQLFGDRFTTIRYEDFASNPRETLARICDWMGRPPPDGADHVAVHPPKPAFREGDRRWLEAAALAGFQQAEMKTLL
jgi:hypothetical protein